MDETTRKVVWESLSSKSNNRQDVYQPSQNRFSRHRFREKYDCLWFYNL